MKKSKGKDKILDPPRIKDKDSTLKNHKKTTGYVEVRQRCKCVRVRKQMKP